MNLTIAYLVLLFVCLSPGSVIKVSGQGQTTGVQVLERGDDWQCASIEERERARKKIHQIANLTIVTAVVTGHIHTCNGTPGWRRVAFINMTDTSYNCPTGLNLTSYSKRTCGRSHTTWGGCSSITFIVGGRPYSCVCGRMTGYQFGAGSAFWQYTQGINSYYVDGVSLTHGGAGSRQHIWTFAAGATEVNQGSNVPEDCPCDSSRYDLVPSFVGNNYFCESGLHSAWRYSASVRFYPDDVLWDGEDCTSTSTCCQLNNPPWFTKNLPSATTDDIELRLCTSDIPEHDDVPIELIELYVQ